VVSAQVTVGTGSGLHARPAARLVQEASRWGCRLTLIYRGHRVDAKSILQVLSLGVKDGETISIEADGKEEEPALAAVLASLTAGPDPGRASRALPTTS